MSVIEEVGSLRRSELPKNRVKDQANNKTTLLNFQLASCVSGFDGPEYARRSRKGFHVGRRAEEWMKN